MLQWNVAHGLFPNLKARIEVLEIAAKALSAFSIAFEARFRWCRRASSRSMGASFNGFHATAEGLLPGAIPSKEWNVQVPAMPAMLTGLLSVVAPLACAVRLLVYRRARATGTSSRRLTGSMMFRCASRGSPLPGCSEFFAVHERELLAGDFALQAGCAEVASRQEPGQSSCFCQLPEGDADLSDLSVLLPLLMLSSCQVVIQALCRRAMHSSNLVKQVLEIEDFIDMLRMYRKLNTQFKLKT